MELYIAWLLFIVMALVIVFNQSSAQIFFDKFLYRLKGIRLWGFVLIFIAANLGVAQWIGTDFSHTGQGMPHSIAGVICWIIIWACLWEGNARNKTESVEKKYEELKKENEELKKRLSVMEPLHDIGVI